MFSGVKCSVPYARPPCAIVSSFVLMAKIKITKMRRVAGFRACSCLITRLQDQIIARTRVRNKFFDHVTGFKYSGTLIDHNNIYEEIKRRPNSEDACYHTIKGLLSSSQVFKYIKIKVYKK